MSLRVQVMVDGVVLGQAFLRILQKRLILFFYASDKTCYIKHLYRSVSFLSHSQVVARRPYTLQRIMRCI